MVPGSFWPGVDDVIASKLCIGLVPNGDGSSRVFFMRCYPCGKVDFYEDPDSRAARSSPGPIEPNEVQVEPKPW